MCFCINSLFNSIALSELMPKIIYEHGWNMPGSDVSISEWKFVSFVGPWSVLNLSWAQKAICYFSELASLF